MILMIIFFKCLKIEFLGNYFSMAKSINCKCFLIPVYLQFKCLGEENKNVNHVIKRLDFTSRSFLAVSSLHACSSLLAYSSADILTTLQ